MKYQGALPQQHDLHIIIIIIALISSIACRDLWDSLSITTINK